MRKSFVTVALTACLFLLIVSAKWAAFARFGSPIPDWDQWDAEAVELFIPWFGHDHFLSHLFHPHNEHRVILTKLQNLALVLLNGQWDSRLEAVTNAMLHAALGAAFWVLGRRIVAEATRNAPARTQLLAAALTALLFVLALALFGLPIAWQNVLGGFHSQQYWLLALSFAAIVTLPFARAWSARWWFGAASAILVLGSMGSGFLAAATVIVVVAWRLFRREISFRAAWPTIALTFAVVLFGFVTRHEVEWHQDMKAKSVHDFVISIVHSMQWPWRDRNWAALVLWLPWLLTAGFLLLRPRSFAALPAPTDSRLKSDGASARFAPNDVNAPTVSFDADRAAEAIVALGGWVILQLAATAYARGAGADYPASRYMDTLTFGAMANALALAWLFVWRAPAALAGRIAWGVVGVGWLLTLSLGTYNLVAHTVRWELDGARKYYANAEGNMRRYLATNDRMQLAHPDIPFPSADGLVERLAVPSLRRLMPVPIRAPLNVDAAGDNDVTFALNDARNDKWENPPRHGLSPKTTPLDAAVSWGSFGAEEAAATGTWKSAPITPGTFRWLKFELAGDLGPDRRGDVSLALHDARTGDVLEHVLPSKRPGDTWRAAYVRNPRRPYIIVAQDHSADAWLAFSPPVEMGGGSFLAWQATKHGLLLLHVTAAVTALLAAGRVLQFQRRRTPAVSAASPATVTS